MDAFTSSGSLISKSKDFSYGSSKANKIWIEDRGIKVPSSQIQISKRIGVDYAGKDALLPYRFLIDYK